MLDDGGCAAQFNGQVQVIRVGSAKRNNLSLQVHIQHFLECLINVFGRNRHTELNAVHTEFAQHSRQFDAIRGGEHHPGGLLAVPQGNVVHQHLVLNIGCVHGFGNKIHGGYPVFSRLIVRDIFQRKSFVIQI